MRAELEKKSEELNNCSHSPSPVVPLGSVEQLIEKILNKKLVELKRVVGYPSLSPHRQTTNKKSRRTRKDELHLVLPPLESSGPSFTDTNTVDSAGTTASMFTFGRSPVKNKSSTYADATSIQRPYTGEQTQQRQRVNPMVNRPRQHQGAQRENRTQNAVPPSEKVLLLPPPTLGDNAGKKQVTTVLKEQKIYPRTAGIRHTVEFSSGAALLTVEKDKINLLLEKVKEFGIEPKRRIPQNIYEFKLHGVPTDLTAVDTNPTEIISIKYKKPTQPNQQYWQ